MLGLQEYGTSRVEKGRDGQGQRYAVQGTPPSINRIPYASVSVFLYLSHTQIEIVLTQQISAIMPSTLSKPWENWNRKIARYQSPSWIVRAIGVIVSLSLHRTVCHKRRGII